MFYCSFVNFQRISWSCKYTFTYVNTRKECLCLYVVSIFCFADVVVQSFIAFHLLCYFILYSDKASAICFTCCTLKVGAHGVWATYQLLALFPHFILSHLDKVLLFSILSFLCISPISFLLLFSFLYLLLLLLLAFF